MQLKKTHCWEIDPNQPLSDLLLKEEMHDAAQLLREGGLVAFPTETVYGLGADATSSEAVKRIFLAKGRPSDNPLIIHFGEVHQIREWVQSIPPAGEQLLEAFVPGPLTLILPHSGKIVPEVTAGLPTVGVRIPNHPVARALLQLTGHPVAAPSANRSGRPSPTEARHVWQDLQGRIELLLDGGPTGVGVESTVVDVTGEYPILLRPGGVSLEDLQKVVPTIQVDLGLTESASKPRSPGMKYRHYAPEATMWLVKGNPQNMVTQIQKLIEESNLHGKKVGVLTTTENEDKYKSAAVVSAGSRKQPESVARNLFQALRQFDELKVDVIYGETFPEEGIFFSVMNRLRKAADGKFC
ncbi:L-threonylcarbamoyladenylate synthase [Risungbinella massiliensis]|uniref:L-threonylcarbamoyladenylate synthase n=1 Tax=Risungbinella massiliensis TaxID=1329796 RepID=UPI000B08C315|nr:L-threonylcarbamoyladenylate synthase [Risungbinella massiliensis]